MLGARPRLWLLGYLDGGSPELLARENRTPYQMMAEAYQGAALPVRQACREAS